MNGTVVIQEIVKQSVDILFIVKLVVTGTSILAIALSSALILKKSIEVVKAIKGMKNRRLS